MLGFLGLELGPNSYHRWIFGQQEVPLFAIFVNARKEGFFAGPTAQRNVFAYWAMRRAT
jgi:hypothetical protein